MQCACCSPPSGSIPSLGFGVGTPDWKLFVSMAAAHDIVVMVEGEELLLDSALTCTKPVLSDEKGRTIHADATQGVIPNFYDESPLSTRTAYRGAGETRPSVYHLGSTRKMVCRRISR